MDKYDVGKCINCGIVAAKKVINANGGLCEVCKKELEEDEDVEV